MEAEWYDASIPKEFDKNARTLMLYAFIQDKTRQSRPNSIQYAQFVRRINSFRGMVPLK